MCIDLFYMFKIGLKLFTPFIYVFFIFYFHTFWILKPQGLGFMPIQEQRWKAMFLCFNVIYSHLVDNAACKTYERNPRTGNFS